MQKGRAMCDAVEAVERDEAEAAPVVWTFDTVQDALIEAHELWRRSPRVGHRPLKSCWPNEMLQRIDAGDIDARGGDMVAPELRPLPLSRAEVARRDAVSEWLRHIPVEVNRRVVVYACAQLASGYSRVSWAKVLHDIRKAGGASALGDGRGILSRRYERAIGAIVVALNHPDVADMVAKGEGPRAIAAVLGLSFAEAHAMARQLKG